MSKLFIFRFKLLELNKDVIGMNIVVINLVDVEYIECASDSISSLLRGIL